MAAVPDAADLALLVVGKGSNLLVHDDGFPGLAIRLGDGFATMAIDGREVRAGGGAGPARARPPDGLRRAHRAWSGRSASRDRSAAASA